MEVREIVTYFYVDDLDIGENGIFYCFFRQNWAGFFILQNFFASSYTISIAKYVGSFGAKKSFNLAITCKDFGKPSMKSILKLNVTFFLDYYKVSVFVKYIFFIIWFWQIKLFSICYLLTFFVDILLHINILLFQYPEKDICLII